MEKYKKAIERQGMFGKLFLEYSGCPRGPVGRACLSIEEEVFQLPQITDVDGGKWIPVNADALTEIVNRYTALRVQKEHCQWISVEERLPERTMPPHDVLVYHDLGIGRYVDRAWYSYEKNKWRSFRGMNLKVTHWMPLPSPPEEGGV